MSMLRVRAACMFGDNEILRAIILRCCWCDAGALRAAAESACGRTRLRQLLRHMPDASRVAALQRIDEDLYINHFEVEFGARHPEGDQVPDQACDDGSEPDGAVDGEPDADPAPGTVELDVSELREHADSLDQLEEADLILEAPPDDSESSDTQEDGASPRPPARSSSQPKSRPKPSPALPKRAAKARAAWPSELCSGFEGSPCTFSVQTAGRGARVQRSRGEVHCAFCSATAFRAAAASPRSKISQMLKKLWALDGNIAQLAVERIRTWEGQDVAAEYAATMKTPVRRRTGHKRATPSSEWPGLLARRRPALRALAPRKARAYEEEVRKDRRLARRKIFFPENLFKPASLEQEAAEVQEMTALCGVSNDVAANDTGLPSPKDATAQLVEAWCKHGSWAMCKKCGSVQPRPLQPIDLRRPAPPTMSEKACTACRHAEYVPQLEDIPEQLRDLKPSILRALRPLDIDTGTFQRAQYGYRIHSSMATFAWAPIAVEDKIAALAKRKDRTRARTALEYLLTSDASSYKSFYDRHCAFLERHGADLPEKRRKLPLRFVEEAGLECALWPHLYWRRDLCETVARASHEKRQQRKRRRGRGVLDSDTGSSEGEEGDDNHGRNVGDRSGLGRIKRGFLRKVLSPVVGYGADYDLLHFVYDLSLWTTIGTKKNVARQFDIPIRLVLATCPWTPQYWRIRHLAVLDMQRQCGNAALFRTRAPYERTFPYHAWVLHEQRAVGASRLRLPGPETLHQAHVLLELDRGLFCGARKGSGRAHRTWSQHLLAAVEPPDVNTVLGHVTRLEFQDGKRKRARQAYHGRGTTHSHSLDFLENKAAIRLQTKLSAHLPPKDEDTLLHGLVLDGQRDYTNSGVEVREESSAWDEEAQLVRLQHTKEDKELCIRPYFPQAMGVTKCHEDVQQGNDNGAVLRYVATYAPKFSDSMDQEWLNDQASDYSVARRILFSYHPLEPEMWLTLAQERFPQIVYSGSMMNFMTPSLDCSTKPQLLRNYEDCTWRKEDMTFLEFVRKTNKTGAVIRHIREKHRQEVLRLVGEALRLKGHSDKEVRKGIDELVKTHKRKAARAADERETPASLAEVAIAEHGISAPSLEAFANAYQCRGEKLVAAGMHSMSSDRYYGQWLVLNVPFRRLEGFLAAASDIVEKVPAHYQHFAIALRCAPNFWGDDRAIEEQMALEAQTKARVSTILSKVRAQRFLVARYLSGDLDLHSDVEGDKVEEATDGDAPRQRHRLTQSQKRLGEEINARVATAMLAASATSDEEYENAVAGAQDKRMLFAGGPPGTGKTFAVHDQIRTWAAKGARVLFVLPTGQLASAMRGKHPHIDVDTFHGGLLFHRDLSEALGVLTQYDLVILDEVSMLTASQFERVLAMWRAAERLPCMVLLGDFWQLPVIGKEERRCDESATWKSNVKVVHFHEQIRCKDARLQRKLDCLRTAVPSARQLKDILRGRRAWKTAEPTAWDVLELLRAHPHTTIVTCTRGGSAVVNGLAAKVLFHDRHKVPLGTIPMDYEANEANFDAQGKLQRGVLEPSRTEIFEGQRIFLTRNIDKANDFVNGMSAVVENYDAASMCLHVTTATGKPLAVHLCTEDIEDHGRVTSFPVRLGYACTIPKVQGATLSHITIWLDRALCRAAAYVAMSRVEHDEDYLVAGHVGPKHFIPAH